MSPTAQAPNIEGELTARRTDGAADSTIHPSEPSGDAELEELVNKLAAVRARLPNAVDQVERDSIDAELGQLLRRILTETGDELDRWLPQIQDIEDIELHYWKLRLGAKREGEIAAALERLYAPRSNASLPAKAQPGSIQPKVMEQATSEPAATEADRAAAAPLVTQERASTGEAKTGKAKPARTKHKPIDLAPSPWGRKMKIEHVEVDAVLIGDRLRPTLDQNVVASLTESICERGLLNPIQVYSPDNGETIHLVAGAPP
jgi:hypothetical protein